MTLVTDVYRATPRFPGEERYALTNLLRKAALSLPRNMAAGQARFSAREFYRFLSTARGSLVEVETHLPIAMNLDHLADVEGIDLLEKTAQLGRVLNGLLASSKTTAW